MICKKKKRKKKGQERVFELCQGQQVCREDINFTANLEYSFFNHIKALWDWNQKRS